MLRRVVISYAISAAVWLSIGVLGVVQEHVNNLAKPINSPSLWSNLLFFLAVAILTPPVFWLGKRLPLAREHWVRPTTVYLAGFPLFLFLFACVRWTIAPVWSSELHRFVGHSIEYFWPMAYAHFSGLFWIYLEILLTANALVYFERARSEALERAEVEKALAASELQLLKMQLQPHFLFNTLHGIATLASDDPPRAADMILQLASLLRATVEHSNTDLTSLREELKFINAYLDLEKMRLGSRMAVRWSVDDSVAGAQVPHMVLLPLVENAVVHGIASSRNAGIIEVAARRVDKVLRITVTNSVGLFRMSGTGVGLRNTQSRLQYLYGDDASLQFSEDEEGRVAVAVVQLPLLFVTNPQPEMIQQEA